MNSGTKNPLPRWRGFNLLEKFTANNTCGDCYTSTRGNSERPPRYLFLDHLPYLWSKNSN